MIVAIGNVKGGVGKTTLAVNLAIAFSQQRRDVLLIDGDEQGTAMAFTELRSTATDGQPGYTAVALHGAAIRSQVRQLAPKYDDIVIDVGGRDTGSLRAALTVAEVIVIPVQPRSFDLWGAEQTAELIREARELNLRLLAVAVLNIADASGKDNDAAVAMLRELPGIEVAGCVLVRRKAYANAATLGRSVLEHDNAKASSEFRSFLKVLSIYRKK